MIAENKTRIAFYHKIGGLFYAVAAADKVIRKEETDALKKMVEKEWLPLEESVDQFGSDAAYQILAAFDWHLDNKSDIQQILKNTEEFYERHHALFTPHVKLMINKTCEAIAYSYAGKNKSEQVILSQITQLLLK